jgi:hypothetical protein
MAVSGQVGGVLQDAYQGRDPRDRLIVHAQRKEFSGMLGLLCTHHRVRYLYPHIFGNVRSGRGPKR